MDNDKIQEYLSDATAEGFSNCCGAGVYFPDICKGCGDHCEVVNEE